MTKVTVLGAGSIGCYVAGCLLSSGAVPSYVNSITLIGRERLQQDIAKNGIKVTDWQGRKQIVNPEHVTFALDNKSLEDADYILLCVKAKIPPMLQK